MGMRTVKSQESMSCWPFQFTAGQRPRLPADSMPSTARYKPFPGCNSQCRVPWAAAIGGFDYIRLSHKAADEFLNDGIGPGFNLLLRLILNGMRHVDRVEIRAPKRSRLRTRWRHEFSRGHGHGGNAPTFHFQCVVQTARGAGPSIGQRFNQRVDSSQLGQKVRRGGLCERRFHHAPSLHRALLQ